MPEITPQQAKARTVVGETLTIVAGTSSESLDKFSTWFLAGFAAAFAVILSSDTLEVSKASLHCASRFFILGAVACSSQRYFAAMVSSGVAGFEAGRKTRPNFQSDAEAAEYYREFSIQMTGAVPLFMRGRVTRVFKKMSEGDLAVAGRDLYRLAILQGVFGLVGIAALIYAAYLILIGLGG